MWGSPGPRTSRWGNNWPGSQWRWVATAKDSCHRQQHRQPLLWCWPVGRGPPRRDGGGSLWNPMRPVRAEKLEAQ